MILVLLILVPVAAALAVFGIRSAPVRRGILAAVAVTHAGLTVAAWRHGPQTAGDGWLVLDTLGLLFLSITSALFLATTVYAIGYLRSESLTRHEDWTEGFFFMNEPEAVFSGCLLLFLAAMTLVTMSQHFGLLWVAVEATTLASAPLIYFHRHHRSLEATWKYLLICSVGIALALLGNFLLAAASADVTISLTVSNLIGHADKLDIVPLKAAFLFFLVGYGTKMGLAPLHTWLPDAHSEAPSLVSALLSGALLNCAFLAILRVFQVVSAAGQAAFAADLLVGFGLLSMAVAAVFIVGQADFKRMLAYSSVEHVGILALGVGLGGAATFGSMLHAVNHSLTKAALFLVAGNIMAAYGTRSIREVSGVARVLPISGVLWLAGFFAIVGAPPFGPFLSEFTILKAALDQGRPLVAAAYLTILALVFIGMATIVLRMTQGSVSPSVKERAPRETYCSTLPPACLAAAVLLLGLYVPGQLSDLLHQAAHALGGH